MVARRLIVTGPRDFTNRDLVRSMMWASHQFFQWDVLVHGAAPGADTLAMQWVGDIAGQFGVAITHDPHHAEFSRGSWAGPERNQKMVDLGAVGAVAFVGPCTRPHHAGLPPHQSHGTKDCMARILRAGIPLWAIGTVPGLDVRAPAPTRVGLRGSEPR